MNFALSEEQELLQEAARGTLGRVRTVEAAREALDGSELPDLWPASADGTAASHEVHEAGPVPTSSGAATCAELAIRATLAHASSHSRHAARRRSRLRADTAPRSPPR